MPSPTLTLQIEQGPAAGQRFAVSRKAKTIGSGADCEIVINDSSIAFEHARLRLTDEGYVIDNLTGLANIFVNNKPVNNSVLLRTSDQLQLGQVVLQVQTADLLASTADDDATWLSPPAVQVKDQTIIPNPSAAASSEQDDRTFIPPAISSRPVAAAPASDSTTIVPASHRSNNNIWLWVMAGVILFLAGTAGILAYKRYATPVPLPTPVAQAAPPTAEPTETPTPLPHTPTASPAPLGVPGLALAAVSEQSLSQTEVNLVDPFCNSRLDLNPEAPVVLGWQQRLAEPAGEIDYVAQWLATAHYDLSLDGRPIANFNYERDNTTLKMWANLGLLAAGEHYLRIEQYTSRPVSTGLDLHPADGIVDEYEAGLVAEGFCELSVAAATVESTATASPTSTSSPSPTASPTQPTAPRQPAAAPLGIFQDFETNVTWKRGDQPNGTFTRNSAQAHSGRYAGQLSYDFPTAHNDYVVFLQNRKLAGRPNGISIWVYGDGSSHFLNAWLKDSAGQTWQMSFGQIEHTGWQQMTAFIDPNQPWPSGHISGSDNGVIDYPLSFSGLTLDDGNDSYSGRGVIYLDDLSSTESAQRATPTPAPTPTVAVAAQPPAVHQPTPPPPVSAPPSINSPYILQLGAQHRYEEPWGAPRGDDPCHAWRTGEWDDRHAGFRGFNVELILTNNSAVKVTDTWPESMRFVTAAGEEVKACYYDYTGAGPVPSGQNSVTFFTVVSVGDFVQRMELSLNGQVTQLCLDGRGGASYC